MKASLKGKYDYDKSSAAATVAVNAGSDLKIRASMTDATFISGPSLAGLSVALEKPGFFIIDYNVPKNDVKFQFMNTVRVLEKPLNLTYTHCRGEDRTALDGTLVFDSSNKVSANHVFGSRTCKVKYTYVHAGTASFEPSYDFGKNSWDFSLSKKIYGDDAVRASYQTSNKVLALQWSRNSEKNGCFKIASSLNLGEELKWPKISAETTWNFEM
ncbi:hypothetical protein RJ641_032312 [Dillenia turbinata]|uniref:Uncharacterized protein n=1 Tax=Dillenia turbinata TaxID=194707 RepID=A0AAN8ZFC3_9MAGN